MAFALDASTFGTRVGAEPRTLPSELLDLIRRPAWMADAACREHPELDWFPARRPSAAVLRVCAGCLVRAECGAGGANEAHGVWAGTTGGQRTGSTTRRAPRRAKPTGAEDVIAALAGEGLRPSEIAARLNAAGVDPPAGFRRWWAADVAAIVRSVQAAS